FPVPRPALGGAVFVGIGRAAVFYKNRVLYHNLFTILLYTDWEENIPPSPADPDRGGRHESDAAECL
ncbi:hypothetical protein, partial [Anaerotruncus massiliensis (ex Liu et al. 2021)]|uniref:hypothetical protein n=1 Tax=Anaerotruncus massiliensis (ex Liu et al. 2021) TaxID=2321404 RepID=UPI003AB572E1